MHNVSLRLSREEPFKSCPDLIRGGATQNLGKNLVGERGVDCRDEKLILENPLSILWIGLFINGGGRLRTGPIDKTIELVAFEKWKNLSIPKEVVVGCKLDGDKVSCGGDYTGTQSGDFILGHEDRVEKGR